MTIILGNILDNAIEASKKVDEVERKIILKIKEENGKFIIYIQNKFNGNLKITMNLQKIMKKNTGTE